MNTLPDKTHVTEKGSGLADYLRAEPVLLAMLFALAVVSFLGVTGLSRLYHAQQKSLANRWYQRGVADLGVHNFEAAALDFRTALRYSRDNYSYQLSLAEALIGLKRINEAQAYLLNLRDREPENGFVNLELARIASQGGDTEHGLRYYHNAIYATWSSNPTQDLVQRREARVELIEYLLKTNATTQAQAELIALAANLGDDPEQQKRLGDLFMRAHDYEHALAAYRNVLRIERHNAAAQAGAGQAAFQLGQYAVTARYLQAAAAGDPKDAESAALLNTTELVLQLDPYARAISPAQRARIVMHDFELTGDRLKSCDMAAGAAGALSSIETSQRGLGERWMQMKPHMTARALERDPDLTDSAMGLAFDVERQTAATCGAPQGADEALLIIAKSREGR